MASAKMAVRTRTAMIRKPATTFLLRSSRFTTDGLRTVRVAAVTAGLCITDPRVDQAVAEVDEQVHNGEDDAEHEHGTLNHREIALTDRKSTRLNSSHVAISYAVFCLKK